MTKAGDAGGGRGPIFLAGCDRSGIGLLAETLNSHPHIFISRRTRFWNLYYGQFGDLSHPSNAARAVNAMMRHPRIAELQPNPVRLLQELAALGRQAGYADLFRLVHEHHLEAVGKNRWGDKSLSSERHAELIFREYPGARMIHVLRDPRDRYASQAMHRSASRGRVGAGVALWLSSARWARRNAARYPGRYKVVRYEDLVSRPTSILQDVCRFLEEPFDESMLRVESSPQRNGSGRAGTERTGELVTTSIGRYREDLQPREVAFIVLGARRQMKPLGYDVCRQPLAGGELVRLILLDIPLNTARMAAWWLNTARRGRSRVAHQPDSPAAS